MTHPGQKSDIASAYDRWAETYDLDPNLTRELAAVILRERRFELVGRNVVEIGCGTGYNTQWLAEYAARVLAMDFSRGMLRKAKARVTAGRVQFVEHDLCTPWPVADASADLVIAMLVLEHVKRLEPFFAESARALRVGGDLFICELHPTRQLCGRQAEFTNPQTGEPERVPAFLHDLSEYVNGGLRVGCELVELGEWRDPGAVPSDLPRLMSVHLRLRAGRGA